MMMNEKMLEGRYYNIKSEGLNLLICEIDYNDHNQLDNMDKKP